MRLWVLSIVRCLAFVVMVVVLQGVLQNRAFIPLMQALRIPHRFLAVLEPRTMALSETLFLVAVLLATAILAALDRRPFWTYGFARTGDAARRYLEGVAYGVGSVVVVGVLMYAFGGFKISGFALSGSDWIVYPLLWLLVMLLVGFVEEAAFRGYPLFALSEGIGFWPAAIVMTLLFGAAHLNKPNENAIDISSILFIGLFLCFTLWRTGSLWLAAGFHFAFDYMQFFVIGTRNGGQEPLGHLFNASFPGAAWINGGALGTEASVFVFPVVAVLWILVARLHPRVRFSPRLLQPSHAL